MSRLDLFVWGWFAYLGIRRGRHWLREGLENGHYWYRVAQRDPRDWRKRN